MTTETPQPSQVDVVEIYRSLGRLENAQGELKEQFVRYEERNEARFTRFEERIEARLIQSEERIEARLIQSEERTEARLDVCPIRGADSNPKSGPKPGLPNPRSGPKPG
jgi:hypothetical protein